MNRRCLPRLLSTVALFAGLAACGSSSGGGIGGTGFVAGVINGFGSVFVDGVEFDTTSTLITIDGLPAVESDLGIGMVVSVDGRVDSDGLSGEADMLAAESLVVGSLDRVAADRLTVEVSADRIVVEPDTILDGITIGPADVGAVVRVSGFRNADDSIVATRIARDRSGATETTLTGVVRDLDEAAETFRIRQATIDYSAGTLTGILADGLRDGLIARVTSSTRPSGGIVAADAVVFRQQSLPERKNAPVRASGIVTARPTARRFVLNGRITVRIDDRTEIVGGTAADLRLRALVSLAGRTDDANSVVARIVVIRKVDVGVDTIPALD